MLGEVFRMFSQLDRSLERSEGGLGIGLTLARSLVELHGGAIKARSEGRGKGSEFVVRLPLAPAAPSPSPDTSPATKRAAVTTVTTRRAPSAPASGAGR